MKTFKDLKPWLPDDKKTVILYKCWIVPEYNAADETNIKVNMDMERMSTCEAGAFGSAFARFIRDKAVAEGKTLAEVMIDDAFGPAENSAIIMMSYKVPKDKLEEEIFPGGDPTPNGIYREVTVNLAKGGLEFDDLVLYKKGLGVDENGVSILKDADFNNCGYETHARNIDGSEILAMCTLFDGKYGMSTIPLPKELEDCDEVKIKES